MGCTLLILIAVVCGTDQGVAKWLEQIESGSREKKIAALEKLQRATLDEKLGSDRDRVIAVCTQLLATDDIKLGEAACDVLSWMDNDVVEGMVTALKSDNTMRQGRAARVISAVASRGRGDVSKMNVAIDPLAKLMKHGEKYARHHAFYAMADMGPDAIEHLVEHIDAADFFGVLMRGLLRHGELSIAPLCHALQNGDLNTQRSVGMALFQLAAHKPELHPALKSEAFDALTAAIDHEDRIVRSRAIDVLGKMGQSSQQAIDKIVASLDEPDPPSLTLANAVAQIGAGPKHLDALVNAARAASERDDIDDQRVVWAFGTAIGSTDESGVSRIMHAADDRHEVVQKTAMYALFTMGPKAAEAVPLVTQKLKDRDPMAPQVLGAIGPKAESAVPALVEGMAHEDWARPRGAFMIMHQSPCGDALAAIGVAALPELLKGLGHDLAQVRAGSLVAIEKLDSDSMIPLAPLERLLLDENHIVRGLAIAALMKHGEAEDILPAIKAMRDDQAQGVARMAQRVVEDIEGVAKTPQRPD